jgi:hypothetical protein
MPVSRRLMIVLVFGLLTGPAAAAEAPRPPCLTKAEQRAAVAARRAIPLAQALRILREHRQRSEVIRARLCRRDDRLVYVLTLLGSSGKVVNATVDAVTSEYHIGR